MRRSRRWLGGLALATGLGAGCLSTPEVPSLTLAVQSFRHTVTAEGTLKAATVTPLSVPSNVRRSVRLAWVAPDGQLIREGELLARFDASAIQDRLQDNQFQVRSVGHRVGKTQETGAGRRAEIDKNFNVADLELEIAQRYQLTDETVFSRHEIIESRIDETLAGARRDHAEEARITQDQLLETDLALLDIERRKAQIQITQAEEALTALEVRAPHDGLFTLARTWNGEPLQVGSELWRSQPIGEIPDLSVMEAEVFVLEADAGGLEVGKPVEVVVESHPIQVYAGTIAKVDAVAKPRFKGSPVQYFGVTVSFEEGEGPAHKPGQRVQATLLLADVERALVVPRQAVFEAEGAYHVFVRTATGYEVRPVSLGVSSLSRVELVEGVAAGDVVALHEPAAGSVQSPNAMARTSS